MLRVERPGLARAAQRHGKVVVHDPLLVVAVVGGGGSCGVHLTGLGGEGAEGGFGEHVCHEVALVQPLARLLVALGALAAPGSPACFAHVGDESQQLVRLVAAAAAAGAGATAGAGVIGAAEPPRQPDRRIAALLPAPRPTHSGPAATAACDTASWLLGTGGASSGSGGTGGVSGGGGGTGLDKLCHCQRCPAVGKCHVEAAGEPGPAQGVGSAPAELSGLGA